MRNRYLRGDRRDAAAAKQDLPLRKLASWFHQDFALMGIGPVQWGEQFFKSLPVAEKRALKLELAQLLASYPGKSGNGLKNAWVRLGAQSWPKSANLKQVVESWLGSLN